MSEPDIGEMAEEFFVDVVRRSYARGKAAGAEEEREACARVVEKSYRLLSTQEFDEQTATQCRRQCAELIRNRSTPAPQTPAGTDDDEEQANKLVDGLLAKARTKEWRPIEPQPSSADYVIDADSRTIEGPIMSPAENTVAGLTEAQIEQMLIDATSHTVRRGSIEGRRCEHIVTLAAEVRRLRKGNDMIRDTLTRQRNEAMDQLDEARAALERANELRAENEQLREVQRVLEFNLAERARQRDEVEKENSDLRAQVQELTKERDRLEDEARYYRAHAEKL